MSMPLHRQGTAIEDLKSSTILPRLRLDTRREHTAVEQALDFMSPDLTTDIYRGHLERLYGFYSPLERCLQERLAENLDQALELRFSPAVHAALVTRLNKTNHLKYDLQCLGVTAETLPLCRDLPPLNTPAEMLGCLYVVEGATLGGRVITQHVRTTLGIKPDTGGSFFECYGDDTGRMWQNMRQLLVSGSSDAETENTIVSNATRTFASLRNWLESFQQQRNNRTAQ
jgi:heme oxygenase